MIKQILAVAAVAVFVSAAPAAAQRVEVSGTVGWTFSDGVEGDAVLAPDGNLYDTIDIKDSFNWGFGIGFNVTDNAEVGFLFGQQMSTLAIDGTRAVDIGDLSVNTYHPYFAYNFAPADARIRPYVMFGAGATNYGSVDFTGVTGARSTQSETQFSTTWGAGVKVYGSSNIGFKAGVQWTPTYITTDSEGWWCDPYWGCYVVGDAKYANQFSFNGGVTIRF